jgi:hypothetical protein
MSGPLPARNWRPLLAGWLWTAALELLLVWFVWFLPLAEDLVRPFYFVALLPGLWCTWRWLRPRGRRDRRAGDRRRAHRRGDGTADR